MGDYGKPYFTYTPEMCEEMKKLVSYADILTPNVTEACILTDTPYREDFHMKDYRRMAEQLSEKGPKKIVITGIMQGEFVANYCYEKGEEPKVQRSHKVGTQRSGHGRHFYSHHCGRCCEWSAFPTVREKASHFIKKCIERSVELEIPLTDGVCFEEVLYTLKA